jgi:hypothetical protein
MPTEHPTIDLQGYERLRAIEKRIDYSPVGIVLLVIGCVGLGMLAYGLQGAFNGADSGPTIPLAGFGLTVGSFCGLIGFLKWRLSRLKCPHCGAKLQRCSVDLTEGIRWPGYEIDGRYYCQPFGDDHDHRPWVRLMKAVRVCEPCRSYVDGHELLQETCREDDLERIRRRFPNHERDTARREAWGKRLAVVWAAFLLIAFFLLWWSSIK